MKKFEKLLIIFSSLTLILSATCFAADEVILIESLTFDKYIDENEQVDNDLLSATLTFSSEVEAEQFSFILTTENITELNDSTSSKVIYIDQFASPENGVYKFTVEKSRIAAAINSQDINSTILYAKMGGMGIDNATLMSVVYEDPESDIIYGDISGDGSVGVSDAIFILRAIASGVEFTEKQNTIGDVNCDGDVTVSDVIRILQHIATSSIPLGPKS